jgi:hypothetical protein
VRELFRFDGFGGRHVTIFLGVRELTCEV